MRTDGHPRGTYGKDSIFGPMAWFVRLRRMEWPEPEKSVYNRGVPSRTSHLLGMKVVQLLIVMALVSVTVATRQVRTCNGVSSSSLGMKVFMADCPLDRTDVSIYDCGEANAGGTWMDCQLVAEEDILDTPGASFAKTTILDNCDDDDHYLEGRFAIITAEGDHTDQLCLTAIKHDSTTSLVNFCNNLDSSLYHSIENSKGMCEEPEWADAAEYGRLVFGETESYSMAYAYFMEKSQSFREANVVRGLTNEPDSHSDLNSEPFTDSFMDHSAYF